MIHPHIIIRVRPCESIFGTCCRTLWCTNEAGEPTSKELMICRTEGEGWEKNVSLIVFNHEVIRIESIAQQLCIDQISSTYSVLSNIHLACTPS